MIQFDGVTKTFNAGTANELVVLNNVSFNIPKSSFVVIIGSNGAGKSSLLNCIAGSFKPDKGKVLIDNQDVTSFHDYERSNLLARIFQNPTLGTAPELSILENFRLAALRTQSKKLTVGNNRSFELIAKEKISKLKMGLESKLNQPMGTLSGGQRQALTLVMATMDDCKVLLLDEPTAALDPKSANLVMEKASEIISENKLTAVMVTHKMKDAITYGDTLFLLHEGSISKTIFSSEKLNLKYENLVEFFN
jgi:putative tryptophan/tyrosine transport system ATP-binding protein